MTTKLTVDTLREKLVRDASDLGWAPGQVPQSVLLNAVLYRYNRTERDSEGDVQAWYFLSTSGKVLVVFND